LSPAGILSFSSSPSILSHVFIKLTQAGVTYDEEAIRWEIPFLRIPEDSVISHHHHYHMPPAIRNFQIKIFLTLEAAKIKLDLRIDLGGPRLV
jgi:hypothetical protein